MLSHMNKLVLAVLAISMTGFGTMAAASNADAPNKQAKPNAVAKDSSKASTPATDAWRFVRHEGRWWYYLPSRKFVYWNGTTWVNPATVASRSAGRRYSYEPGGNAPAMRSYRSYGPANAPYSTRDPARPRADQKVFGY